MCECDTTFSTFSENVKYFLQLLYLAPGAILQIRIFWVLRVSKYDCYSKSSFFTLWSIDSLMSFIAILIDVFSNRPFIFFPQHCEFLTEFLETYWVLPHLIYPVYLYVSLGKFIVHAFLSINRATCVLMPTKYGAIWAANLKKVIVLVLIYPFFIIWNVIISEKDLEFILGGFFITYIKRVEWASLSGASFISFVLTLTITLISTGITLSKMSKLKKRMLSSERHLCFATSLISLCFLICVLFSFYFAFFWKYVKNEAITDIIYLSQYVAIDLLNVGSPIIMIMACQQLREHVFFMRPKENGDTNGTIISFTRTSSSNLFNNFVGHSTSK